MRFEPLSARKRELTLPAGVVQSPIETWVTPARTYALGRGITPAQVARWRVGYAVIGRMQGRIVFPVYSAAGRLLQYEGRTYVDDKKRYLAAHEEEGPDEDAIFGEQWWPEAHALRDVAVVFEGSINGLAVERVLPEVALAGLGGSNVTPGMLEKLATFARVLVLTDPDAAGDGAARAILESIPRYTDVRRVELPAGQDARDVEARDPEALRAAVVESAAQG